MLAFISWLPVIAIVGIIIWELASKERGIQRSIIIASIAFIVGLTALGSYFMQSRMQERTLRVTGYASKQFESDLVKWSLSLQKTAYIDELKDAYNSLSKDMNDYKARLIKAGFEEKDINIQPPTSSGIYSDYGHLTSYSVTQSLYLLSSDISKVESQALDPSFFADRGLLLQRSDLEYLYSKLPELKKQLIAEATTDAMDRAKEITGASKSKLGKLKFARAGVFQITEPYSTDVSDYGYYSTDTRSKSISVTVAAEYDL
ncbi:MAG: SIMPL domain-containing protein [Candidatus Cloacimonetes bacterium]|nr:SIMPL domain-containing protein [Candidatus Cloacimonadota bacterium]